MLHHKTFTNSSTIFIITTSITSFKVTDYYHNILRQTLEWQIINRCINEVSQQSINMLNYSTSLLQYLHLNYWVTDSSSDYETVMKQFFITKHLITKHLITTSTNWVTDVSSNSSPNYSPHSSPNSSSHFSSDLYSPQYFHNNFIQIWRIYFITNFQRIIFEKHLCYCSSNVFNTTSFTNSLLQSLSDRCFDKLFTNIQMSYIFHRKHSQISRWVIYFITNIHKLFITNFKL